MNSGTGTNDGVYRITYDDGMETCFITPGGQIAGLTYGDRKFNMVGKCKKICGKIIKTGTFKTIIEVLSAIQHPELCFNSLISYARVCRGPKS